MHIAEAMCVKGALDREPAMSVASALQPRNELHRRNEKGGGRGWTGIRPHASSTPHVIWTHPVKLQEEERGGRVAGARRDGRRRSYTRGRDAAGVCDVQVEAAPTPPAMPGSIPTPHLWYLVCLGGVPGEGLRGGG